MITFTKGFLKKISNKYTLQRFLSINDIQNKEYIYYYYNNDVDDDDMLHRLLLMYIE